jgi:hypothetical protein
MVTIQVYDLLDLISCNTRFSQKAPGIIWRRRFGAPWVRTAWTECDGRTLKYSKRRLRPVLPTMAGSIEQVCARNDSTLNVVRLVLPYVLSLQCSTTIRGTFWLPIVFHIDIEVSEEHTAFFFSFEHEDFMKVSPKRKYITTALHGVTQYHSLSVVTSYSNPLCPPPILSTDLGSR